MKSKKSLFAAAALAASLAFGAKDLSAQSLDTAVSGAYDSGQWTSAEAARTPEEISRIFGECFGYENLALTKNAPTLKQKEIAAKFFATDTYFLTQDALRSPDRVPYSVRVIREGVFNELKNRYGFSGLRMDQPLLAQNPQIVYAIEDMLCFVLPVLNENAAKAYTGRGTDAEEIVSWVREAQKVHVQEAEFNRDFVASFSGGYGSLFGGSYDFVSRTVEKPSGDMSFIESFDSMMNFDLGLLVGNIFDANLYLRTFKGTMDFETGGVSAPTDIVHDDYMLGGKFMLNLATLLSGNAVSRDPYTAVKGTGGIWLGFDVNYLNFGLSSTETGKPIKLNDPVVYNIGLAAGIEGSVALGTGAILSGGLSGVVGTNSVPSRGVGLRGTADAEIKFLLGDCVYLGLGASGSLSTDPYFPNSLFVYVPLDILSGKGANLKPTMFSSYVGYEFMTQAISAGIKLSF